jgi:thymidylate synthase (FAD)
MDLHNLFHFLHLRMHPHAQLEIRRYAEKIWEIVQIVCPLASESFENHIARGESFSAQELGELRNMAGGGECGLEGKAKKRLFDKLGLGLEFGESGRGKSE